ncbi:MAG: phosphoglycolate phosphatase [Halobacteria archaeon]|nr:phosphoglycolate phosphatase [Halobacteria archaeon]
MRPLALDVDGTLTGRDGSLNPSVIEPLKGWDATVVIATGKTLAHATALCRYVGIDDNIIAENGGIVYVRSEDELVYEGDGTAAKEVIKEYVDEGYDLGWGKNDLLNKWRETEAIVSRDSPLEPLREVAQKHGLEVVDTGYAYHVKSPNVSKGKGLKSIARILGVKTEDFVAVGDSENDVSTFEVAGTSYAVRNADEEALESADYVTEGENGKGLLEVLDELR